MIVSRRSAMLIATSAVAAAASSVSAHVPLQPPGQTVVQVNLSVGGTAYTASGSGECTYAADAGIYEAPAQMWGARRRDADKDVSFTMWRLASGGDMFSLAVTSGGRTHRVNTVQVGPPANRRGSGTAKVDVRGKGGQFTVNAVADTGTTIIGTIACSAFVHPEENGD